jgi:acyl-CoA thioesterase-1
MASKIMQKMIKTMVCHGDSLTEASDVERRLCWPSLVEKQLQLKIINSGIAGDTTGGLLSRFYPSVVQQQPDFVLIMGGTNDLWWDLDLKLIRANIFAMTCQAEHHAIVPLIGLPPPIVISRALRQDFAAPDCGYEKCFAKLAVLVKILAVSAEQNEIACLDFYHPFFDKKGAVQDRYFLEDGLHPNEAGHRVMAAKTIELLQRRLKISLSRHGVTAVPP